MPVIEDEVLFTLGGFDVRPATFYASETTRREEGYAVVWVTDGVTQLLTNNIAGALSAAAQSAQTLAQAKALMEQEAAEASTEGLLDVVGDDFPEGTELNS